MSDDIWLLYVISGCLVLALAFGWAYVWLICWLRWRHLHIPRRRWTEGKITPMIPFTPKE